MMKKLAVVSVIEFLLQRYLQRSYQVGRQLNVLQCTALSVHYKVFFAHQLQEWCPLVLGVFLPDPSLRNDEHFREENKSKSGSGVNFVLHAFMINKFKAWISSWQVRCAVMTVLFRIFDGFGPSS